MQFTAYNNVVIGLFIRIAQSFCLGLLLRYFAGEFDETHGLLYATGVILCSMYYNTSHHPCFYFNAHLNMKIRIACSSLVFRKVGSYKNRD